MQYIGNEKIVEIFEKKQKNGTFSHAYLFIGGEEIGKKTFAMKVSSKILDIPFEKVLGNPDIFFVKRERDQKTEKLKKGIDTKQIRELRDFFAWKGHTGKKKIAIIDDAHLMSAGAANALLKVFEEPGEGKILFLISSNEFDLPATIISRAQNYFFSPAPAEKIKEILEKRCALSEKRERIAFFSEGKMGKAQKLLTDEEYYDWHLREEKRFKDLFFSPFFDKIQKTEDMFGDKTDHLAARENLIQILKLWLLLLREDFLLGKSEKKEMLSSSQLLKIEKKVMRAIEELSQNVHPRLLIEQILLEIP